MLLNLKSIIVTTLCLVTLGFGVCGSVSATETTAVETLPTVTYQTHVQNVGWQDYVPMSGFSGTEGKGFRLEGIRIKLADSDYDLGIDYQTHIENVGWENAVGLGLKHSNEFSGTSGRGFRLEGIKINLTGADADKFKVVYQVHVQNVGWQAWKENGVMGGTEGRGLRLEGIRIKIVPVVPPSTDPNYEGDTSWDKNVNGILDDNEIEAWRALPVQIIFDPNKPWDENGNGFPDPDERPAYLIWFQDESTWNTGEQSPDLTRPLYVPWTINLPVTEHQHRMVERSGVLAVNGVAVYEQHQMYGNIDITQQYNADVANGCIYNYVEWLQGYGNSYYPTGIESLPGDFTYQDFALSAGSISPWANEKVLGHKMTDDEFTWFNFHPQTSFYFCLECGHTSLIFDEEE